VKSHNRLLSSTTVFNMENSKLKVNWGPINPSKSIQIKQGSKMAFYF